MSKGGEKKDEKFPNNVTVDDYANNVKAKQNEYLEKIAENSLEVDSSVKKFSKGFIFSWFLF
jgi:hypothetical protein